MKLYGKFLSMHIKKLMAFKISFIMTVISQFLDSFNVFLGVFFMFQRFSSVRGFDYAEVLFCFGITLLSITLAECFFRGFDTFSSMLAHGEFDRILVRPQSILFQVIASKVEFACIGRLFQAIVMFFYGIMYLDIIWTWDKIFLMILMIMAGVIVFASLYILYAGLCFFTLEGLEVLNIVSDGAREFGRYPIAVYGKGVLKFCTYLVPFALFQYYPFLYLLGRDASPATFCNPLLAALFFLPCYTIFRLGVSHYQSIGS